MTTMKSIAEARRNRIVFYLKQSSFGIEKALSAIESLGNSRLLIVVDQFEELFRYANSDPRRGLGSHDEALTRDDATRFAQLLLEASRSPVRNVHILLTMRSDFIGECSRFKGLPEAVSASQFLVPSLTRDQLQEVIEGPIEKADATIEPALVQTLLNDSTGGDFDQLPVLQHCLLRLWERAAKDGAGTTLGATSRKDAIKGPRRLTETHYEAIGRMSKALSIHADEIFAEAGPPHVVERIFRSLSEIDKQRRAIRRAIPFSQLCAETGEPEEAVRAAADRFRDDDCSFLIPSKSAEPELKPDTQIDVGHEALLRGWKRVSGGAEITQPQGAAAGGVHAEAKPGEQHQWLHPWKRMLIRGWAHFSGQAEAIRREIAEIGWLRAEARDGEQFQWLRSWYHDNFGRELPLNITNARARWWAHRRATPAWADRYGGDFDDVDRLIKASVKRKQRSAWVRVGTAVGILMFLGYWGYSTYQGKLTRQQDELARTNMQLERAEMAQQRLQMEQQRVIADNNFVLAVNSAQKLLDQLGQALNHGDVNVNGAKDLLRVAKGIVEAVQTGDSTLENIALLVKLNWSASDIYATLGDLTKAYDSAKNARDLVQPFYAANPNDPKVLELLYNSTWRMGDAIADRDLEPATMEQALALYMEAENFARRLVELQPDNPRAQRNIAFVQQKIGDTSQGRDKWDEAFTTYNDSLTILQKVVDSDPDNREWKRDLANTLSRLGQVLTGKSNFDRAMEYFNAALKIRKELADDDKNDDVMQSNLATSYREIGRLYAKRDKFDAAMEAYRTAIGIRDNLLSKDPSNAAWQVSLAPLYTELGAIYKQKRDLKMALEQYQKAYALRRQIALRDTSIAARQRAYANTGMTISGLLLQLNLDLEEAVTLYRAAIETLDDFRPRYDQDVFQCYIGIGDVQRERADAEAALIEYRRAAGIAEETLTKGVANNAVWLENLRLAYLRIGGLLIEQGRKGDAIAYYQKAIDFMERTPYPENVDWSALVQWLKTEIEKLKA